MAKSPKDLAWLTEIVQHRAPGSLQKYIDGDYKSIRVGFGDAPVWEQVNSWQPCEKEAVEEMVSTGTFGYDTALAKLDDRGLRTILQSKSSEPQEPKSSTLYRLEMPVSLRSLEVEALPTLFPVICLCSRIRSRAH